jgi:hypothetical protein
MLMIEKFQTISSLTGGEGDRHIIFRRRSPSFVAVFKEAYFMGISRDLVFRRPLSSATIRLIC